MAALGKRIRDSQLWKSIFRHPPPTDRRNRMLVILTNLVLHLHPVSIRKHALALRFTWCMGGITFFLFLVETLTGVLLMFYYRPTLEWAYLDMSDLRDTVTLGSLRELHRWGAHAMVIAVWLHMYRVFLTGSYKPPREFNWVLGVWLLVLTLLLSFTGYLLPWDQLAMWAVTVGSNMAGAHPLLGREGPGAALLTVDGRALITDASDARFALLGAPEVGEAALIRFYVLHCLALPLAAMVLSAIHFWRVRKDGGISGPL
jgi:quinol-cytochrome oxidoreductase complex cytochrome b subunit